MVTRIRFVIRFLMPFWMHTLRKIHSHEWQLRHLGLTVFWSLAVSVCALDLWSKYAIFRHLNPNAVMDLIPGCLRFALALNDGAAFSIARGKTTQLVAISAVALVGVLGMFIFGRDRSGLMTVSLGLFAGGISGNLYDRAFNGGQVRDFIDAYIGTHHWPTFNIADSALCIAVGSIAVGWLISAMRAPRESSHQ